tara:strand:- start:328 stop:660 length:333 start_codon:yes stop_codon:yes gene_type:complete
MKNFVSEGQVVTLTAPYEVASGQGLLVGSLFGVAATDAVISTGVEALTTGVVNLTKAGSQAWTQGAKIYWDDSNRECTTTASGNKLIGAAVRAEASAAIIGRVRLNGVTT